MQRGIAMKNLTKALEQFKPSIEMRCKAAVVEMYESYVRMFGSDFRNIANAYSYNGFKEVVRPLLDKGTEPAGRRPDNQKIVQEKLNEYATAYADFTVGEVHAKIIEKLGDIENIKIDHVTTQDFQLSGTRNGHKVFIQQQVILKSSTRGLLFNQFPARIYVDGKFISAKKYKEFFA